MYIPHLMSRPCSSSHTAVPLGRHSDITEVICQEQLTRIPPVSCSYETPSVPHLCASSPCASTVGAPSPTSAQGGLGLLYFLSQPFNDIPCHNDHLCASPSHSQMQSGIGQCVMGAEGALRRAFPRAAPRSRGCFAKSTPAAFPPDQFLPCLMLLFAKRSRELEWSCKPFWVSVSFLCLARLQARCQL